QGQGHTRVMSYFVDRNRVYLVLVYFSLSFFYLAILLDDQHDPLPLLGYILALIVVIILTQEALLRVISQATGHLNSDTELKYFSAFLELNRKIHNFMEVDDVLVLVNDTLRDRIQVRRVVFLLSKEIPARHFPPDAEDKAALTLRTWPDSKSHAFHTAEFEREVEKHGKVM